MYRLLAAGLVPVLTAVVAGAQPPAPVVTEAEFLSVLKDTHPALAARSQDVATVRASVVAASLLDNPSVAIVREDPSGPTEQTDLTVSWQLPRASRRLEIESAEQDVEAAEARFLADALSLRLTLRGVYAGWAVATARREQLAVQVRRVAQLADRESTRAERGEASPLNAHRLALASSVLKARLAAAETAVLEARSVAQGWASDLPADAVPVLPELPAPVELEGDHPRLAAAAAELQAAELAVRAAGRFLPTPELTAGWQRQTAGAASVDGPLLALTWSLPVFGRNQAGIARAEARRLAAEARMESVRREIEAERLGAVEAYRRLTEAYAEVSASLASNDKTVAGAVASFRLGETAVTDLLETLRSIAESESAALDLYEAALAAHRNLERLAGRPLFPEPGETHDP